MMNWKGFQRKQSLYNQSTVLEGVRNTTINLSIDSLCPSQDLNIRSPKYKFRMLITTYTDTAWLKGNFLMLSM